MTENELHNQIVSFTENIDLISYVLDISDRKPFYCLVWYEAIQKVSEKHCICENDARNGVYLKVDRIDRERMRETAFEWIHSGQAAKELFEKARQERLLVDYGIHVQVNQADMEAWHRFIGGER